MEHIIEAFVGFDTSKLRNAVAMIVDRLPFLVSVRNP